MAECGIRTQDIARCTMGKIDPKTLRKHFRQELAEGRMKANMLVARTLYEKATVDKDVTALIWWTKTQMGWKAARDEPKDVPGPKSVEKIERVIVPASSNP